MKKMTLATKIFLGLLLGIGAGFALMGTPEIATGYIQPFGTIFLNLIKFIVVPIVLFSIMAGVISMKDVRKVGSIGGKTLIYYFTTTAFAIVIGLVFANLFRGSYMLLETSNLVYEQKNSFDLMQTIVNVFPSNCLAPLVNATMLQVIVISLLMGFGIILVGEKAEPVKVFVESINSVCLKVMEMIIALSPIGVFCLITPVVALNGPAVLGSLAMVLLTAYLAYIVHAVVTYSSTLKLLGNVSPLTFFKGVAPAMMMAFSSASSVGALPLNMECVEKLGGRRDVISFTLPLGATINMDGTAIYQGVCAVFIASCFGIDLTLGQMATIVLTATLASVGTAGVPGSGMIMLAMVLESVGLPVAGIALVAGVDRIFDMGRTTVNITGDAACALIISNLETKREAAAAVKAK